MDPQTNEPLGFALRAWSLLAEVLATGALRLCRFLLRLPRRRACPSNLRLLKRYLQFDHSTRRQTIARLAIPAFGGLHPKNIFNFRSEFFLKHVQADDVVLDVGCGSGKLLEILSGSIKLGIGIDWDAPSIEKVQAKKSHTNLDFIVGNILTYDFPALVRDRQIGIAVVSHVLEHIEHPIEFLHNLACPVLLICVPSQENWLAALKKHYGLPYFTDPTHFREYTRQELVEHLAGAGYSCDEIGFNGEGEIICRASKKPERQ